eukprot:Nk52_evm1s1303 gene=Nk52_evmTU1s1303
MAPIKYGDLGKQAKDLYNKNYGFGEIKVELKSKTDSGVEFTAVGTKNNKSGAIFGNLETAYKYKEHGISFTEKWNTKNVLNTEIAIEDAIAKGFKVNVESSFAPNTGEKTANINATYKQDLFFSTCDLDLFNGPTISTSTCVGLEGCYAGVETSYNVQNGALKKTNFALAYKASDYIFHAALNDMAKVNASVFHACSSNLSSCAQIQWNRNNSDTLFAVGTHYKLDSQAFIKARIDNNAQLGVSYTQNLRKGVKLTLSALVDGKQLNTDSHKLGLGLVLEA